MEGMRTDLALLPLLALPLWAEDPPMAVNPNRPTFSAPARTTQFGLAELETGAQRVLQRDGSHSLGTPTLLKLGVLDDFEVRLSTPGLQQVSVPGAPSVSGPGDLSLGVQWRFAKAGWLGLDQAVQVMHTFPTASASQGLGAGAASDSVVWLLGRSFGDYSLVLNFIQTWAGRPAAQGGGRVGQPIATCALSRPLGGAWSLSGEVYAIGATELNPRVVSNLWAVGYQVSPRLVLDAGVDVGLTQGAQKVAVFAGLTVGLGRFSHGR